MIEAPTGGEAKLPPTLLLGAVVHRKVQELMGFQIENGVPEEYLGYVILKQDQRVTAIQGDIDEVEIKDLRSGSDGVTSIGVQLFSDSSPFVREEDLAAADLAHMHVVDYDAVCFSEYPPFLIYDGYSKEQLRPEIKDRYSADWIRAYLEAARAGKIPEPLYIDESFATQLANAVSGVTKEDVTFEDDIQY